MGFKATDVTPLSVTGPTVLLPSSKDIVTKVFSVSRSETTSVLKAVLPADASIIDITRFGSTNSDAATTATVALTIQNNSGTLLSPVATDVKTAGNTTIFVQCPGLPNLESLPLNGDIRISAQYAETGTASTTGGPWLFRVQYVR